MATKQHQILAVEATRQAAADKQMAECTNTFSKKENLFTAKTRVLTMFGKDETNATIMAALEAKDRITGAVQYTVPGNLNYMAGVVGQWYDVLFQKELTNQKATADVTVDGQLIFKGAPATFLLGMETKLNKLRDLYLAIPTHAPGVQWEPAPEMGVNIFKSPISKDIKMVKTMEHVRQQQSSDKHPDTFVQQEKTLPAGEFTDQSFTGMISVAAKASLIARLDKVMLAVKDARQRANDVEAVMDRCATGLFAYLHGTYHDVEAMKAAADGR
jgi:hypothetical protein